MNLLVRTNGTNTTCLLFITRFACWPPFDLNEQVCITEQRPVDGQIGGMQKRAEACLTRTSESDLCHHRIGESAACKEVVYIRQKKLFHRKKTQFNKSVNVHILHQKNISKREPSSDKITVNVHRL